MGLKRKLFPESSTGLIPDDLMQLTNRTGNSLGSFRTKKAPKENATGGTKLTGDSLATIHVKCGGGKGLQNNNAETKKRKDSTYFAFEPSVLVTLHSQKNVVDTGTDNNKRKVRQVKEQRKKATSIKTAVTTLLGEQRMVSNSFGGGILTCLENNTRSRGKQRSRAFRKKETHSTSTTKRNAKTKAGKSTISNGDSLLTSLFKASIAKENCEPRPVKAQHISEQLTSTDECDERELEKSSNQETKPREKVEAAVQSRIKRESYSKTSKIGRKSQHKTKKGSSSTCEPFGLGAFVGMTMECTRSRRSRKEQPIKRLVSPSEGNAKSTSIPSSHKEEITSLHPGTINTTNGNIETDRPSEVPSVIIVPMIRESDPSNASTNSVKDQPEVENLKSKEETAPSKIETAQEIIIPSPKPVDILERQLKDKRKEHIPAPSKIELTQNVIPYPKPINVVKTKVRRKEQIPAPSKIEPTQNVILSPKSIDLVETKSTRKEQIPTPSKIEPTQKLIPFSKPVGSLETESTRKEAILAPSTIETTQNVIPSSKAVGTNEMTSTREEQIPAPSKTETGQNMIPSPKPMDVIETEPTRGEKIPAPSKMDTTQKTIPTPKPIHLFETKSKEESINVASGLPNATEEKKLWPKYNVGTRFEKHFRSFGWFTGTVVAFKCETGLYHVYYEDGDSEDLEEIELDKCKIQTGGPVDANGNEQQQSKTNTTSSKRKTRKENSSAKKDARKDETSLNASSSKLRSKKSEKNVPVRRSRRLSGELNRRDVQSQVQSESQTKETNLSVRRSKRRRSEPIRFIDAPCTENQRTTQSTARKRRKIASETPKQIVAQEDDALFERARNPVLSPLADVQKSPKKKQFDDALRAVMPAETEDDNLNSNPMRTLFTRSDSDDTKSDSKTKHNSSSGRRSKRKSIEPDRYGTFESSASKSCEKETQAKSANSVSKSSEKATKSLLKRKRGISKSKAKTKTKKRVRISIERPEEIDWGKSDPTPREIDLWTKADLKLLHKAHRTVDPTSFSFWEDVAEIVGDKSATECREKWFSLAKTPEPKRPRPKKQSKGRGKAMLPGTPRHVEDDIFNSTPMRNAFGSGQNIDVSGFEELGVISRMNVGSSIKIHRLDRGDGRTQQTNNEQVAYPLGYKTYLQNIGRSMRQKDSKKKKRDSNRPPLQFGKKLTGRINEGDVEVKCRLSPGGTLQVDAHGDTDTEDYLEDDDDENEDAGLAENLS